MLGHIDVDEYENSRAKAEEAGRGDEWAEKYDREDFIYTTSNLDTDIYSATRSLDPSEVIYENGFSKLVLEYFEYQALREEYDWVPAGDDRYDFRAKNPETDAQLFFWGAVTTLQSDTARNIVQQMIREYGVPTSAIRGYDSEFGTKTTQKTTPQDTHVLSPRTFGQTPVGGNTFDVRTFGREPVGVK